MKNWAEKAYDEQVEGVKLAEVTTESELTGDIVGTSTVRFLLAYAGSSTPFIGLEHVSGKVKGQDATLVLEHKGSFMDGGFHNSVRVVSGSGTGALAGCSGSGVLVWGTETSVPGVLTLDLNMG